MNPLLWFVLVIALPTYYFYVILSIALGEYTKRKNAILDLAIPFGFIFRVALPAIFVKFPMFLLNQLKEMD